MQNLLTYGAIGLGLALAILTFKLIQSEQKKEFPRSSILRTTYFFMCFTVILSIIGFSFESYGQKNEINLLQKNIEYIKQENSNLKTSLENLKETSIRFEKIKHAINSLLNTKGQILKDWKEIDQSEPAYIRLVKQIQKDITILHNSIQKELDYTK